MELLDWIRILNVALLLISICLLITLICLVRKCNKTNTANTKFKVGQIVYVYRNHSKELVRYEISGIVVRKNEILYELNKSVIYKENDIYETYEQAKSFALECYAKELDDSNERL